MMHRNLAARGFSLIELMVAMAVGIVTIMVIGHVHLKFDAQSKVTSSAGDAQTNGALALYMLERDIRMAGYGFGVQSVLGCQIRSVYNGVQQAAYSLTPVMITNGASSAPDTIQIMASTKDNFSVPARIVQGLPNPAANWKVNSIVGMTVNDILIAHFPGETTCSQIQITGLGNPGNASDKITVVHNSGQSDWNPNGSTDSNYVFGNGIELGTRIFNLGSIMRKTYSISGTNLQTANFNTASNSSSTEITTSNLIDLQAEYGKDTNADRRVDTWDVTNPTTAAGWAQVIAIHVAVLSRTDREEKTNVSVTAPRWRSFATGSDVNFLVSGNANWQRYRYRVYESIVPLRNVLWSQL